jgi:hypothetical protein
MNCLGKIDYLGEVREDVHKDIVPETGPREMKGQAI